MIQDTQNWWVGYIRSTVGEFLLHSMFNPFHDAF